MATAPDLSAGRPPWRCPRLASALLCTSQAMASGCRQGSCPSQARPTRTDPRASAKPGVGQAVLSFYWAWSPEDTRPADARGHLRGALDRE